MDKQKGENWGDKIERYYIEYQEETGKHLPSYQEMLGFDEERFKAFLHLRLVPPYREQLLAEMIDHEEATHSFGNNTPEDKRSKEAQMIYEVFVREKSSQIVKTFDSMKAIAEESLQKNVDLTQDAIFAKGVTDFMN